MAKKHGDTGKRKPGRPKKAATTVISVRVRVDLADAIRAGIKKLIKETHD